jgi:hypothetical protein
MRQKVLIVSLVVLMLAGTTSSAWAGGVKDASDTSKDSHRVKNKWDLSGEFVAHPGYNWGGLAEGATWTYGFHIKEAMYGEYSVGSIHFATGDIDVVCQVKATKRDYAYWPGENLAAVGTCDYNDIAYNFMFLYAERAVWLALSTTQYNTYWDAGTVWGSSLRAYQLHSKVPDETFLLDYKVIHQ